MSDSSSVIFDNRVQHWLRKYSLQSAGWLGTLCGIGYIFKAIPEWFVVVALLYVSCIAGMYGHHGAEMGWFDAE